MSIQSGDLVKITTKNSTHEGKTGKVVHVFEDEKTVTVKLEEHVNGEEFTRAGVVTGFFVTEMEVLKGVDEDEQVEKIATALLEAERETRWVRENAVRAARALYTAGVRHSGK